MVVIFSQGINFFPKKIRFRNYRKICPDYWSSAFFPILYVREKWIPPICTYLLKHPAILQWSMIMRKGGSQYFGRTLCNNFQKLYENCPPKKVATFSQHKKHLPHFSYPIASGHPTSWATWHGRLRQIQNLGLFAVYRGWNPTQSRWWFQFFFIFIPKIGKIPILTSIFQMGWFNHQLAVVYGKS